MAVAVADFSNPPLSRSDESRIDAHQGRRSDEKIRSATCGLAPRPKSRSDLSDRADRQSRAADLGAMAPFLGRVEVLAGALGSAREAAWTDAESLFAVMLLRAAE